MAWHLLGHRLRRGPAKGGKSFMYFVYIIHSQKKDRYYIGVTADIKKRLASHNSGANHSTRAYIPWVVIYQEEYIDKRSAWLREKQIKSYKGGEAFKKLIRQ